MSWNYTINQPLNLKMPVAVNAAGNIAQEGETAAGQKLLYFATWSSDLISESPGAKIETFTSDFVGDVLGANYDMLNSKITADYVAEET